MGDFWQTAVVPALDDDPKSVEPVVTNLVMDLADVNENRVMRESLNQVAGRGSEDDEDEDEIVVDDIYGKDDGQEKAMYQMRITFMVLASECVQARIEECSGLEGFDFLGLLLRNNFWAAMMKWNE